MQIAFLFVRRNYLITVISMEVGSLEVMEANAEAENAIPGIVENDHDVANRYGILNLPVMMQHFMNINPMYQYIRFIRVNYYPFDAHFRRFECIRVALAYCCLKTFYDDSQEEFDWWATTVGEMAAACVPDNMKENKELSGAAVVMIRHKE